MGVKFTQYKVKRYIANPDLTALPGFGEVKSNYDVIIPVLNVKMKYRPSYIKDGLKGEVITNRRKCYAEKTNIQIRMGDLLEEILPEGSKFKPVTYKAITDSDVGLKYIVFYAESI